MTDRLPIGAISALGVTQIIGYGTLYYSFSILAPSMALPRLVAGMDLRLAFDCAARGRVHGTLVWQPHRPGRAGVVMTFGSAAAAAALIACAFAPGGGSTYVAALIGIEVAANLVQYGAAFALLVQLQPNAAQRSITALTLIAGFASTLFWPLTSGLHAVLSWERST